MPNDIDPILAVNISFAATWIVRMIGLAFVALVINALFRLTR